MSVGSVITAADEQEARAAGDNVAAPDWQSQLETFVGREREMQTLRARIDDAKAGTGSLVLISGEPGIGKTRLLTEASHYAEEQGLLVLWGRCWEGEGAPAFWPWVQILRGLLADSRVGNPQKTLHNRNSLKSVLQELHLGTTQNRGETTNQLVTEDPFTLYDIVLETLTLASKDQQILILLDDAHLADASTLRLASFVRHSLPEIPCLMLATYRDEGDYPANDQTLARIATAPNTSRIQLQGLDRSEVRELFEAEAPKVKLSNTQLDRVIDRTDGNPLFVVELRHSACGYGTGVERLPSVPMRVRQSV